MKRTPEQCIKEEINRLSLLIAIERYDFETAVIEGKPVEYRRLIADSIQYMRTIKANLELGNYNLLPYNVKLLFDK